MNFCTDLGCFIAWLDNWQTMLTGVGAIGAAAVSVVYLRKQIATSEREEVQRRRRRLMAARARLPLSLSDTVHFASEAILLLKEYLDRLAVPQDGAPALATLPRPVLPEQAILAFEALIEAIDDDAFAAIIASMISEMQILNSRMRGMVRDTAGLDAPNLQSYLMNAAKVYAFAAGMFEYARRETDEPRHALNWDYVISALNLNDMYSFTYPDLHAFIERARARAETAPAIEASAAEG